MELCVAVLIFMVAVPGKGGEAGKLSASSTVRYSSNRRGWDELDSPKASA